KKRLPADFCTELFKETCDNFQFFQKARLGLAHFLPYYRKAQIIDDLIRHPAVRQLMSNLQDQRLILRILLAGDIVRPVRDWRPHVRKQPIYLLWDFFRHCCIRYAGQVPICFRSEMVYAGHREAFTYQNGAYWEFERNSLHYCFCMARGLGIHQLLPADQSGINSRMNYFFQRAPLHMDYYKAIFWARLRAMKISAKLASHFANDYHTFGELGEHLEVIQFFRRHPDLEVETAAQIWEFVRSQESADYTVEGCTIRPLYPNFSFKKRSLSSVLRCIDQWEKTIEQHIAAISQKPLPVSDLNAYEVSLSSTESIRIRQLVTLGELRLEGFKMRHCVATYLETCLEGYSTIWSVQQVKDGKVSMYLATVEVSKKKEILQMKARFNQCPKTETLAHIRTWARREGLHIVDW
ncbi:MAG: PcfJ domain-containing protein, partial [Bacteroidota bacterium]